MMQREIQVAEVLSAVFSESLVVVRTFERNENQRPHLRANPGILLWVKAKIEMSKRTATIATVISRNMYASAIT